MFDNIGDKIKSVTQVFCAIGIGICVIAGLVLIFYSQVLLGILIAVLGSFVCYLGSFFAYGFGQLIENTDILVAEIKKRNYIAASEENETVKKEFAPAAPVVSAPKSVVLPPVERIKVENPDVPVKITKNGSGEMRCPVCGTQQRDNRFRCLKCDIKFINGQPSIPYWCASCGQEGPYKDACPKCGSTEKLMNIHQ